MIASQADDVDHKSRPRYEETTNKRSVSLIKKTEEVLDPIYQWDYSKVGDALVN